MRIYNNIPALQAYNNLTKTTGALQKSISKLSSGLRINGASDDAAGLAISEKMRGQIRGLDRAVMNSQDGISMIQTAEGALTETTSILQRMRELSVQSANDTLTQQDRGYIQQEVDQLKDEINRIASTTQFNKKKLLDGSASVLWSSDNLDTKLLVRGGLRQIDQFGQKNVSEGNYKVSIAANPGQAEIQKTDVFKIKHSNVLSDVNKNAKLGVNDVRVNNLPAGTFSTTVYSSAGGVGASASVVNSFGNAALFDVAGFTTGGTISGTINMLFEVTNVDTANAVVTYKAIASVTRVDGTSETIVKDNIQLRNSTSSRFVWSALGSTAAMLRGSAIGAATTKTSIGSKAVATYHAATGALASRLVVSGTQNTQWGDRWAAGLQTAIFAVDSTLISNKDVSFRNFYLNSNNGQVYESNITISFGDISAAGTGFSSGTSVASFKSTYVGQAANTDTQLRDLDKFWDANGRFLLTDPQKITLTQGDGTRTEVTLYANDTIKDVQDKLNGAIADGLGQASLLDQLKANNAGKFVSFVTSPTANSSESVQGTFVIRSVVNGDKGKISFAGDNDLINALSLNTIQDAKENQFYVSIQNAHTGQPLASNVKVSGNVAVGILDPNLDFEFKSSAGMSTVWNDGAKRYDTVADGTYQTTIHVADNTAVFQIGANEGEDMGIDIGDMSARALGINNILLTDQKSAARAITMVDSAIDRVSSQRAKLGAYQNRLDHTINNLTVAGENLTAAESRIRDLDMAKEMMNFTKLNILMQAGNSMLGQANQLPQNVLSLLR